MKKILIPIDASEHSARAVEMGREFAKSFGSNVVILNVLDIILPISTYELNQYVQAGGSIPDIYDTAKVEADKLLENAKKSFGDMAAKVETVTLEGDTSNKIIEYINDNDFDMVIMGSHGMSAPFKYFLLGSVTSRVLHHVKTPVLVVR